MQKIFLRVCMSNKKLCSVPRSRFTTQPSAMNYQYSIWSTLQLVTSSYIVQTKTNKNLSSERNKEWGYTAVVSACGWPVWLVSKKHLAWVLEYIYLGVNSSHKPSLYLLTILEIMMVSVHSCYTMKKVLASFPCSHALECEHWRCVGVELASYPGHVGGEKHFSPPTRPGYKASVE